MPLVRNQIVGGLFQDILGNALASGYLEFTLSVDQKANGQVCSGIKIKVPLDNNGSVSGTVLMWPNDIITPTGSFYLVEGFTAAGEPAYGPQYQQVLSSPSPFDIGTWVPNNTSIALVNTGVNALNGKTGAITIVAGSGVTVTTSGQTITITAP